VLQFPVSRIYRLPALKGFSFHFASAVNRSRCGFQPVDCETYYYALASLRKGCNKALRRVSWCRIYGWSYGVSGGRIMFIVQQKAILILLFPDYVSPGSASLRFPNSANKFGTFRKITTAGNGLLSLSDAAIELGSRPITQRGYSNTLLPVTR